jgi:hypothetical protein
MGLLLMLGPERPSQLDEPAPLAILPVYSQMPADLQASKPQAMVEDCKLPQLARQMQIKGRGAPAVLEVGL